MLAGGANASGGITEMRNLSFFSRSAEWFDNQLFCDQAGSGKMSHATNQVRPDNGNNSFFVIVRNTELSTVSS